MDILDLARGLGVEVDELLSGWRASGLLVVGGKSREERVGLLSDTIGLVNGAGLVSGVVFVVKALNGRDKAGGDTMLLVEINGTLDGLVTKDVSMSKVFSDNAASWLLLLSDLVTVTLGVLCEVASIVFGAAGSRRNLNMSGTKLSVVQEESCLGRGFLLKGYGRIMSLAGWSDFEVSDLATEGEEVLDFFLAGCGTDVLDVNGVGRHDCG